MDKFYAQDLFGRIPDAVETLDGLSKSSILWSKVKIAAIFVFLVGGAYVTLQSYINQLKGRDEKELHKSIYDIPLKGNQGNDTSPATPREDGKTKENEDKSNNDNVQGSDKSKDNRKEERDRDTKEEELVSRIGENLIKDTEEDERVRSRRRRE